MWRGRHARPLAQARERPFDRPIRLSGETEPPSTATARRAHSTACSAAWARALRPTRLIARLGPASFEQVHRSHIVNLDEVRELRPFGDRRLVLMLRNGEVVVASRSASERLRRRAR